jgi:3-dehydroquinate dehydratase
MLTFITIPAHISLNMQIVAAIPDPDLIPTAAALSPDFIEIRLDCMQDHTPEEICSFLRGNSIPVILTVRSEREGGQFTGTPAEWYDLIEPLLDYADLVDIEQSFCQYSSRIRSLNRKIIASYHVNAMPGLHDLETTEKRLRSYGDIPKIVVKPDSKRDVLDLCSFTLAAEKPVVTSIMGEQYRYARVLFPLFGSMIVFCHAGIPTAPGQHHILEMREIFRLLLKGS